MRANFPLLLASTVVGIFSFSALAHSTTCTVPNTIVNGQPADASKVMDNFNAVANCASAAVTATGTPASGSIAVVSGPTSVTSGDLSGDISTSGTTATTLATTGVTPGTYNYTTVTVDAKGRVTAAANGATPNGGGGSSSASISGMRDALRFYSIEHRTTLDTNSFVSGVINWNGLVGFVFEGMAAAGDSSLYKSAVYTVPTGKHAIIVDHTSTQQNLYNPSYHGFYIYNESTNYWVSTANAKSVGDGYYLQDNVYWSNNAFNPQDSEKNIANAGEGLTVRINNPSNDGIKRANGGTFIIAIVDDTTGKIDAIVPH